MSTTTTEGRPGGWSRAVSKAFGGATSMLPVVSGLVRVDVSTMTDERDVDRAVQAIAELPSGARVEIVVRAGQIIPRAAFWLRLEAPQLADINVVGPDGHTTGAWVRAMRGSGL